MIRLSRKELVDGLAEVILLKLKDTELFLRPVDTNNPTEVIVAAFLQGQNNSTYDIFHDMVKMDESL